MIPIIRPEMLAEPDRLCPGAHGGRRKEKSTPLAATKARLLTQITAKLRTLAARIITMPRTPLSSI
jgi:hypothetical protein